MQTVNGGTKDLGNNMDYDMSTKCNMTSGIEDGIT